MVDTELRVFTGNSNRKLAERVCAEIGIELGQALVGTFSDGEVRVEIEENVRGCDVYVIQSLCCPVNSFVVELFLMIDALKRASAERVTAVIPYYAYGRRDKKDKPRVPITGRMLASLLEEAGVDHVVALDFHSGQTMGFFKVPVDHISAMGEFVKHARQFLDENSIVVAPDAAGVRRARAFAAEMNLDMAIMDERDVGIPWEHRIVGNVKDKNVVLYDDIIDTGKTVERVSLAAHKAGARSVRVYSVHGIFSHGCETRLQRAGVDSIVVTDSVVPYCKPESMNLPVEYVSVAPLLAESVVALHRGETLESTFYAM